MLRLLRTTAVSLLYLAFFNHLLAAGPDQDFSGKWNLDARASHTQAFSAPPERFFTCVQQDDRLHCSAPRPDGASIEWSYDLNGAATRYRFGEESRNSKVKWEGSALLINTIVSGARDYSILDRWSLSRDHSVLTIGREIMQGGGDSEGTLVYRRGESPGGAAESGAAQVPRQSNFSDAPPPALQRAPESSSASELVVRAGTRIPLSLRNAINTRHSHEGDRAYLDTMYPVVVNNRIVIPRGSYVIGTLTKSKPAGVVGHKGELFIRFDSLTLPNGVTRDFRSRLTSADSGNGKVDPKEGTITGQRDKSGEARTTAEGAGIGAGIGGLAGAAAGHPLSGVGIGAAAGAAVGLASALGRHRPDASLPRGTVIEMLLDRDLFYQPSEISR